MEISFAYSSPPGKSKAAASNDRISLLMEFYLGACESHCFFWRRNWAKYSDDTQTTGSMFRFRSFVSFARD